MVEKEEPLKGLQGYGGEGMDAGGVGGGGHRVIMVEKTWPQEGWGGRVIMVKKAWLLEGFQGAESLWWRRHGCWSGWGGGHRVIMVEKARPQEQEGLAITFPSIHRRQSERKEVR